MTRTEAVHLVLMLGALALAYLLPFELVLLSYVILGPAHYLTEISWLHDRGYFLPHRAIAAVLAAAALAASFIDNAFWFGIVVWAALVAAAFFSISGTALRGMLLLIAAATATAFFLSNDPAIAIVGILVPTVVHVSLFTLIFMVLGAARSKSTVQFVLLACYLASLALIALVPPSSATVIPHLAALAKDAFGNVPQAIGRTFGIPGMTLDARVTGLLSFIYTYHYLNWFIKAEVIRWADIPRQRLVFIALVSAGSTALYFYDYGIGFAVLFSLSLIHVFLEFPLNGVSIRQLIAATGKPRPQRRSA